MPEISGSFLKFHGDQPTVGRRLRLPSYARTPPLFRTVVLQFHVRIGGEIILYAEHRTVRIHHQRMRVNSCGTIVDGKIQRDGYLQHHALAATPVFCDCRLPAYRCVAFGLRQSSSPQKSISGSISSIRTPSLPLAVCLSRQPRPDSCARSRC